MDDQQLGSTSARVRRLPVLQEPGRDEKVSSVEIGGPDDPRDRVLILSAQELGHLLEVARSSVMGRVELPLCGLRVDTYRGRGTRGTYEVWRLTSAKPRPEPAPSVLTGMEA